MIFLQSEFFYFGNLEVCWRKCIRRDRFLPSEMDLSKIGGRNTTVQSFGRGLPGEVKARRFHYFFGLIHGHNGRL